jgi:hypothetical protein
MSKALEDDSDPTYTHFAHRGEFIDLLQQSLALDLLHEPTQKENEQEERLVNAMGTIVSP